MLTKSTLGFDKKANLFMYPYMFELENELLNFKDDLKNINFHLDEANTDRELKEFIKIVIRKKVNKLPNIDKLIYLKNIPDISHKEITLSYSFFSDMYIEKVLLPDELTEEVKSKLHNNNSVYTAPDLCLKISDSQNHQYISIELKSTKKNAIPGSSIQQINPMQWVIFIKHTKTKISITTGQYIHSINSKLQFPDRSPRPQVAFNELQKWNKKNRCFKNGELEYKVEIKQELEKHKLIEDWQCLLAERWLEVLKKQKTKNRIPWFNNNLRKFIIKFIEFYDGLNAEERDNFKQNIEEQIE